MNGRCENGKKSKQKQCKACRQNGQSICGGTHERNSNSLSHDSFPNSN